MAQTIYTSARDVDVRECKPQQLLRQNYLNEFRTEIEKAKARESLGIYPLLWGNIQGFLEQQTDLVNYIKDNFNYTVEDYENIKSVQEALDYLFEVVTDYSKHKEQFSQDQINLKKCQDDIAVLQGILNEYTVKVDQIEIISQENNTNVGQLLELTQKHEESINRIESLFDGNIKYVTNLDDNLTVETSIGGIKKGTKVSDLEGQSINAIFDQLLFPTIVRELIRPQLVYSPSKQLLEVNTSVTKPVLKFTQNDAGKEIERTEYATFGGNTYNFTGIYDQVGTYEYTGSVTYEDGPKLVNNKGEETNLYIKGGTLTTNAIVNVTYPWYAGNTNKVDKQKLVQIGKNSGDIEISLSGQAVIKLPGKAQLNSLTFDGGLGFLEVDWTGWDITEETINGYLYKVWTKKDSYSKSFVHKINFVI